MSQPPFSDDSQNSYPAFPGHQRAYPTPPGRAPSYPLPPQYVGPTLPPYQQIAGYVTPVMQAVPMMPMTQPAAPGSGLATAGMVCGIVAAVFSVLPACGLFIAVPLGITAVVFGALGYKSPTWC